MALMPPYLFQRASVSCTAVVLCWRKATMVACIPHTSAPLPYKKPCWQSAQVSLHLQTPTDTVSGTPSRSPPALPDCPAECSSLTRNSWAKTFPDEDINCMMGECQGAFEFSWRAVLLKLQENAAMCLLLVIAREKTWWEFVMESFAMHQSARVVITRLLLSWFNTIANSLSLQQWLVSVFSLNNLNFFFFISLTTFCRNTVTKSESDCLLLDSDFGFYTWNGSNQYFGLKSFYTQKELIVRHICTGRWTIGKESWTMCGSFLMIVFDSWAVPSFDAPVPLGVPRVLFLMIIGCLKFLCKQFMMLDIATPKLVDTY